MKLLLLERDQWEVTAAISEEFDVCSLTEFLSEVDHVHASSVSGLYGLFRRFATGGPRVFNDAICHWVNEDPKIWQFAKGSLRVLWFYGDKRIIICSHCFIKSGRKTPNGEIVKAISTKGAYEFALRKGNIEILNE